MNFYISLEGWLQVGGQRAGGKYPDRWKRVQIQEIA